MWLSSPKIYIVTIYVIYAHLHTNTYAFMECAIMMLLSVAERDLTLVLIDGITEKWLHIHNG